jgi:large subunit ribosomal protein L22
MGLRKKQKAEIIKEQKKNQYFAILRNSPVSPRKMRLVADLVRGVDVLKALDILKFNSKEASGRLEELLKSAIANWEIKNDGEKPEKHNLYVKEVRVDYAGMLKRYRPAPQGRAHRIRKRSNHVTLYIDSKAN